MRRLNIVKPLLYSISDTYKYLNKFTAIQIELPWELDWEKGFYNIILKFIWKNINLREVWKRMQNDLTSQISEYNVFRTNCVIRTNCIHVAIDQWNENENSEKDISLQENLIYDMYPILI